MFNLKKKQPEATNNNRSDMAIGTHGSSKPTLSIIVPVYNVENYVGKCLDSILSQTFADFEVIAVDDKSTDGSLAILHDYAAKDSRIIVVEHDANQGVGLARNTGLARIRGKYTAFIDPDDYYYTNDALQIIADTMDRTDACIVQFPFIRFSEKTQKFSKFKSGAAYHEYHGEDILQSFHEPHINISKSYIWDKVYKSEIFTEKGVEFPDGLMEDQVVATKALYYAKKVVLVPDTLLVYLIREGSITKRPYTREEILGFVDNTFEIFRFLLKHSEGEEYYSTLKTHSISYGIHIRVALTSINSSQEARFEILRAIEEITHPHKELLNYLLNYHTPNSWHYHTLSIISKASKKVPLDKELADYVYNMHTIPNKKLRKSYVLFRGLVLNKTTRPLMSIYREIIITPKIFRTVKNIAKK